MLLKGDLVSLAPERVALHQVVKKQLLPDEFERAPVVHGPMLYRIRQLQQPPPQLCLVPDKRVVGVDVAWQVVDLVVLWSAEDVRVAHPRDLVRRKATANGPGAIVQHDRLVIQFLHGSRGVPPVLLSVCGFVFFSAEARKET